MYRLIFIIILVISPKIILGDNYQKLSNTPVSKLEWRSYLLEQDLRDNWYRDTGVDIYFDENSIDVRISPDAGQCEHYSRHPEFYNKGAENGFIESLLEKNPNNMYCTNWEAEEDKIDGCFSILQLRDMCKATINNLKKETIDRYKKAGFLWADHFFGYNYDTDVYKNINIIVESYNPGYICEKNPELEYQKITCELNLSEDLNSITYILGEK